MTEGYSSKQIITELLEADDLDQEVTVTINGMPGFSISGVEQGTEGNMVLHVGKGADTTA